jgi:hypothetical protein
MPLDGHSTESERPFPKLTKCPLDMEKLRYIILLSIFPSALLQGIQHL